MNVLLIQAIMILSNLVPMVQDVFIKTSIDVWWNELFV